MRAEITDPTYRAPDKQKSLVVTEDSMLFKSCIQ